MDLLLPVGTPGGINSGSAEIPGSFGIVRLGNRLICIEANHYRLWLTAASAPRTSELIAWAVEEGMTDPETCLRDLEDAQLLVTDRPSLTSVADRLAIRLIGDLVGNGTTSSPHFFAVGRKNNKISLDQYFFDLLLRTDGVTPISSYFDSVDSIRQEHDQRNSIQALFDGIPLLLRAGVIRLDAAIERGAQ